MGDIMRLSIWQQFSSNHSSSFTVVGEFPTAEKAQQIAAELRDFLLQVHEWRSGVGREKDKFEEFLSPPEQIISNQYNIEWGNKEPIDWLDIEDFDQYVTVFENYVFVTNALIDTHRGAKPMNALLTAMGAKTMADGENEPRWLSVELTCVAPDHQTALQIYTDTKRLFDAEANDRWDEEPIPWLIYVEGKKHERADELLKAEKIYNIQQRFDHEWNRAHWHEVDFEASDETRRKAHQQKDEAFAKLPQLELEMKHFLNDVGFKTHAVSYEKEKPSVQIFGSRLQFHGVKFSHFGIGLPSMLAWLRALNCTEIEYSISEREWRNNL
jgi:hypothetical protein